MIELIKEFTLHTSNCFSSFLPQQTINNNKSRNKQPQPRSMTPNISAIITQDGTFLISKTILHGTLHFDLSDKMKNYTNITAYVRTQIQKTSFFPKRNEKVVHEGKSESNHSYHNKQ